VAERAVDRLETAPDHDESTELDRLIRRRLGRVRGLPRPVMERRLVAFLVRRGFGGGAALRAIRTVLRDD
jgi:hypothetical protein